MSGRALLRRAPAAALALVLGLLPALGTGCTIRYSQTLAGRLVRVKPAAIQNADSGVAAGVGFGTNVAVVTFSEPESPAELLQVPCAAGVTQVDYRAAAFGYYLAVLIPQTKTTTYCVSEE